MTIRLDYHLHTCHSMDCEQSLDTLCAAAVRTGLTEICITDHTEFGHPYPGSDVPPVVEDWLADIEAAREAWPQLTIRPAWKLETTRSAASASSGGTRRCRWISNCFRST